MATPTTTIGRGRATHSLGIVASGAVAGAGWGVAARLWMRSITDRPTFSWSGTLLIVTLATSVGALLGVAHALRRRVGTRFARWAPVFGTVAIAPLGVGAGLVLIPPVVLGAFVLPGPEPRFRTRLLLATVPLAASVTVGVSGATGLWFLAAVAVLAVGFASARSFRLVAALAVAGSVTATVVPLFAELATWRASFGSVGLVALLAPLVLAYRGAVRGAVGPIPPGATAVG